MIEFMFHFILTYDINFAKAHIYFLLIFISFTRLMEKG